MREESCRKCGGNLAIFEKCPECGQSIKEVCKVCWSLTEERIHSACLYEGGQILVIAK